MSDHDELADQREEEVDRLERESEHNAEQAQATRDALERAQADELTPAPMGEDDPAYREGEALPAQEQDEDPARPRA